MLEIIRGDDVKLEFTFLDSEGEALDLTDATIFFTAKENATDSDGDAVIIKDFEFVGSGTSGIAELEFTASETSIGVGVYSYDIQIMDKNGYVMSSSVGKLRVLQDITTRTAISA